MSGAETLAGKLAAYRGRPAVFYANPPSDMAQWRGKRQYPRIDFIVDLQASPERQTAGVLTVNLWCDEKSAAPEELEPALRECLCGVFLCPDGGPPYALSWVRSDAFEGKSDTEGGRISGETVTFDLLSFPSQGTTDPDPVLAMNEFIKNWHPAGVVVGLSEIGRFFVPSGECPAFYTRLERVQPVRSTNTVTWMEAQLAVHIMAPGAETRLLLIKGLADELAARTEITMADRSPLFFLQLQGNSGSDPWKVGQLEIKARYGILRRRAYAHPTTGVDFTQGGNDGENRE